MADIFLSYSREDSARAERLAAALAASGYSVWWDRNLTAGERYSDETEAFLKEAKAVLVLWTRASVNSNWVRDEAAVGRDAGRLVPVTLDGIEPPIGFRQIQTLAVAGSGDDLPSETFRQLLKALERKINPDLSHADESTSAAAAPVKPANSRPFVLRLAPLAAAVAGVALAAAALIFALSPSSPTPAPASFARGAKLTVPPFEIKGVDESLSGLAAGLTHGMRTALRERGFDIRGYQFPETAEASRKFIDRLGVDYVVRGTIAEIGDALLYNIDIVSARDEQAIASFQMPEKSRDDMSVMRSIIGHVVETLAPGAPAETRVSENVDYYMALGLIEDAAGKADFEAAAALLKRAAEIEPANASAHALYAYALASVDRYSDDARTYREVASAAIERAFALGGADADAHFARAVQHYIYDDDFARLARAEEDLTRAIEADPGDMRALKWLVTIQIQKRDYRAAIEMADRALKLSPDYRDMQGNRISAQLFLGQREEARAALDALLQESPDWAWGRRFRASLALTDGDLRRAREEVDRAEAIDAVSWNADLLTIIDANEGALEAAREAIDLQAKRSRLDPAWVSYKKSIIAGDVDTALIALDDLVSREKRPLQRAQALVAYGFLHLYRNESAPARAACMESAALNRSDADLEGPPGLAEVCEAIAAARLGEKKAALALIERFEQSRPKKPLYRPYWTESLLAALYAEIGDERAALQIIQSMIEQNWRTPKTALCRHCVHLGVDDPRGLFAKLASSPRYREMLASIGAG